MDKITPKRVFLAAVLILILGLGPGFRPTAAAAGIGHPDADLKQGQFGLGLELDFSSRDIQFSDRQIQERTRMVLAKAGYGLSDRLNFFGAVGGAAGRDDEGFNGERGTAFGGGIRLRLFEYQGIRFGVTGQALRFSSRDTTAFGIDGITLKYLWNVYDVALGASTKIADSSFYAGALFSKVDGELQSSLPGFPDRTAHFKEAHPVGLLMGGDAELLSNLNLGVELRLFHETALAVRLSYAFGGR